MKYNFSGSRSLRVLAAVVVMIVGISFAFNSTPASAVTGLVGGFGFSEGSGTTTTDSSSTLNNGSILNGAWTTLGKYGNALNFNGTSTYVDLSKPDSYDTLTTGTIEAWVKSNNTTGYQTWFGADSGNCAHPFELALSGGKFNIFASGTGCSPAFNASATVANPTAWHHLAYVVTATGNQFYIDGVLVTPTYATGNASSKFFFSSAATGVTHYNIGRTAFDSTETFNGTIDELRIYNRALSAAEIQTDMNSPVDTGVPAPTAALALNPTTITQGQSSTLTWSSTNATTVTLNQGIGAVAASGSMQVTPTATTTYTLTATNTTGTATSTATVTVNIPDTTPPTVSISAPLDGETVANSVTVLANASDNIGVVGVQFKLDGNNLGSEDTVTPFSFSWDTKTVLTNGNHVLTAVARDAVGNTATSTSVTVLVNNPPHMVISQPTQNANITGSTVTIAYSGVGDMTAVDGARFQIDGGPVLQDPTYDGSFSINDVSPGSHVLTGFLTQMAMMVMGSDATPVNFTIIVPDTTAPLVSVTAPTDGSTVNGTVTLTATASDNVGVAGVQFKIDDTNFGTEDTTSPYSISWDTTLVGNTPHTITAVARDAALNATTSAPVNVTVNNAGGNPSVVGQWSAPVTTPIILVHGHLLNNGKVLTWSTGSLAQILDPVTNVFTPVADNLTDLFCAGEVILTNGNVLGVGGGGGSPTQATNHTDMFNLSTSTWSAAAPMVKARWYPTETVLPDGRVLSTAGAAGGVTNYVSTPEIYNPKTNTWTLMNASANNPSTPNYPFMHVLPDGRVAFVGGSEYDTMTQVLNLSTQTWTTIDSNVLPGSSAVQYAPGKIMKSGSAADSGFIGAAVKSTYVIDFNQANPAWHRAGDMAFPRSFMNLTALPDGNVLVTGGETMKDGSNPANAVKAAELWNPTTETWTTLASEARPRLYHSIAMLLPDGRVLVSGGGQDGGVPDEFSAEYFSPPYLFKGARPTVTSAPTNVQYGAPFFVATPDGASITSVSLIKAAAVTHFTNMEQRAMKLTFSQTAGGLTITAPANSNIATPGEYLLFLVNSNGVPSVAPFITLPSSLDDTIAPTAPSNLSATGGVGSASLTWSAATDNVGVTSYNVYRSTTSGFTVSAANKIGQSVTTSYTDTTTAGAYFYKVTAQDAANNVSPASNQATATVTNGSPVAPVITSFTASPSSISSGGSSTLSWVVTGTPTPTLSIDNGVGAVTGTSKVVSPTATTTYKLTATNSAGTVTAQTTVTVTVIPPGTLAIDKNISKDNATSSKTILSPMFSTTSTNELLLAFVAADSGSTAATVQSITGGGLTWTLVKRTNAQLGTSEVWKAFAPSILTNAMVTATLSQSVAASLTVLSFSGVNAASPVGASVSASAATGAPTISLTTTANNSWVFAVGNDFSHATARTAGANQSLVHQYLAPAGDTYWMQMQNAITPNSGTSVTINDTAPTTDRWNLTAVEVRSQ